MTTLLALDIGGTKVGWGIVEVGQNYTVVERGSIPTEASRGGADVAERICSLASSLKEAHPEASGVAIASAGEGPLWGSSLRSARDFLCASLTTSTHTVWVRRPWEPDAPIPQSFRSQ